MTSENHGAICQRMDGKLHKLFFAKVSKLICHLHIALNFALREFTCISLYCYMVLDLSFPKLVLMAFI